MARGEEIYTVPKLFSKGFVDNKGTNRIPEEYAEDLRNVRIVNNGISVRSGYTQVIESTGATPVQGITSNTVNNDLLYVHNNTLFTVDLDNETSTSIGSVGTAERYDFVNHGKYTIILSGNAAPFVYDGTTLSQASNIEAMANPGFGTRFAGFTVINNQEQPNTILVSAPVTLASPQNAIDWNGTEAESLVFESEVVGMIGTTNNLRVFTRSHIEYLGRGNISNTGGIASLFTVPLATGYGVANPEVIVGAGDSVFFLTQSKQIATINYRADVIEPQVNILSDDPGTSIQRFLSERIDDDQSQAFGIYDRTQNLVKWHVRSNNSDVNDLVLIYDIINNTFLIDDNKNFSCMTTHNERYYAGSATAHYIYEDETDTSDLGQGINWYFETQNLVFNKPPQQSVLWRGSTLAGQINNQANIDREIRVDSKTVFNDTIRGATWASSEILQGVGTAPVGDTPVGGEGGFIGDLQDFEQVVTRSRVRESGRKVRHRRSGNSLNGDFVLDYMTMQGKPRRRIPTRNKTF